MKLHQLALRNYRCFAELEILFHPQLTVLIATNGGGKTTVLDAARAVLEPFVQGITRSADAAPLIHRERDVRRIQQGEWNMEPQFPCTLTAAANFGTGLVDNFRWHISAEAADENGENGSAALRAYGATLAQELTLPLVVYQGTNRRLGQRIRKKAYEHPSRWSRLSGYADCLASRPSFDYFMDWYAWLYLSYREAQILAMERQTAIPAADLRFAHTIEAIQTAIDTLVQPATGWHRLTYSIGNQKQLQMQHPQHGVLPITMLSDGLRNIIALAMDLAHRAFRLNPHLGVHAAQETPGIVLIDEVDMFLHPEWQQTILASLTKAFPKLQFIVTTHSPQVLSTVRPENIRHIGFDAHGNAAATMPSVTTYAEPSGDILYGVMHVDPQPRVQETEDLNRLTEWVDQGAYDEPAAIALFQQLQQQLGEHSSHLQRLQRSIERQKRLQHWKP